MKRTLPATATSAANCLDETHATGDRFLSSELFWMIYVKGLDNKGHDALSPRNLI